ncbi:hypothetical protein N7G274_007793 [Stereocaulon virgatum]|uniref:C2H2-type domain-containing protein n=1 Tax=Stereocaulon virgatum TaxID=373712 RepID=A0ABR4A2J9_9LECA
MCGTNDHIFVRGVPCALSHYFHERSDNRALGVVSRYACEVGFRDWVKTFRQISLDIEIEERVMCPLLWCRKVFENLSSVVDHVRSCDRLSDGWYWCPTCRRPERFLECDESCGMGQRSLPQRKGSKLQRAASFFSCLGRKQPSRIDTVKRSMDRDETDPEMKNIIAERSEKGELDAGPDCQMFGSDIADARLAKDLKAALLANEKGSYRSESDDDVMLPIASSAPSSIPLANKFDVGSQQEMYDPSTYSSQSLQEAESVFDREEDARSSGRSELLPLDYNHTCAELPGSRMTTASLPKLDSSDISMASKPLRLAESYWDYTSGSDALAGMVSPIDGEFRGAPSEATSSPRLLSPDSNTVSLTSPTSTLFEQAHVPGDITSLWRLSSSLDPLVVPKQLHLRTDFNTSTALTTPSDPSTNRQISIFYAGYEYLSEYMSLDPLDVSAETLPSTRGSLRTSSPVPTQSQVEELRDLVGIVNYEWMQRIPSETELYTRCSALSAQRLFDNGARSLQSLICATLPRSFEDVFALMHFAFAAAYVLHREHASYDWKDFFQDALQFHLALSDKSDRSSFLEVMDRWWLAPGLPLKDSLVIESGPVLGHMLQESTIGIQQMDLLNLLKSGEVARNFSEFLDGFEEAGIKERNDHLLAGAMLSTAQGREPLVEHMINAIIHPLQQQRGIEAFRDQVSEAEAQLHNGLLQNLREIEVVLISSGKRTSRSPHLYERYHECITSLCDTAMAPPDPSWNQESLWTLEAAWRDHYYIADLHEILAISLELDKYRSIDASTNRWPDTSVLAVIRSDPTLLKSSPPASSNSCGSSTDSSPTSLASLDSTMSLSGETLASSLISPTALSQNSLSPTSPTFPMPNAEIASCQLCDAKFRGTPQHRKSNLQRHMRTSKIHSGYAGFKCPEPGCSSRLRRTDNLGKHLQTIHGLSSPVQKHDAIRRSRHMANPDLQPPSETFLWD